MIPASIETDITSVARSAARSYPPVDSEDIAQHLRLWYLELDSGNRDAATELSLLRQHMHGVARDWALRERAAWHHLSVHYYYAPGDVRKILDVLYAYSKEEWGNGFVPSDARSDLPYGDAIDVLIDTESAMQDIAPTDRSAIDVWQLKEASLTEAERKAASRAIGRLTEVMNTKKALRDAPRGEPVGTRRVLSNATAREIIRGQQ